LVVVRVLRAGTRPPLPRATYVALIAFAGYVVFSYLSITWAQAPGVALQGSNRALLYLIIFALMSVIPWRAQTAVAALSLFALGVGAIALVLLLRLQAASSLQGLFIAGRLAAPTGYFNSTAALFTMDALIATGLASRRELPAVVRGLLVGSACASLQIAVLAQSRGWLFTLPLVLLISVAVMPDRLRFVVMALMPAVATAITAPKLVAIYNDITAASLNAGARSVGREALILTVIMLVLGTLMAWGESLFAPRVRVPRAARLGASVVLIAVVIGGGTLGAFKATHNDPVGFVKRQWNGFSHPVIGPSPGSHFATVGSGRYDFWRVALNAFEAHPVGGLGQDNFEDYYVTRRHTQEEPLWTHSMELRLLAHTGLVGTFLFVIFLAAAVAAALRARRRGPPLVRMAAGIAILPAIPWLVHGSVDWFWEIPALTGPALGFLGMAGALSARRVPAEASARVPTAGRRISLRTLAAVPAALVVLAATAVLTLPYLSVREVSMGSDQALSNPAAALHDLQRAAQLNPLNADAGTRAGLIALSAGLNAVAKQRFAQSISRERGAWLPWLGQGLADSALGERQQAQRALRTAYSINNQQLPIQVALKRVFSRHPLTYSQAIPLFRIVQ
ncbi:MAG: O-antigen ligase family protein, partial [Solirubrobacteraceae bacterium]